MLLGALNELLLIKYYTLSFPFFFQIIRRVLVMEYINGIPILSLGDEMARRGISPSGKIAAAAKQ